MRVYDRDKDRMIKAEKKVCHNCKGFGGNFTDYDQVCKTCNGKSYIWISRNGWFRPLYSSKFYSKRY